MVIIPDATVGAISKLHDAVSNTDSTFVGNWGFDCKLFRENPASAGGRSSEQLNSSFLCTIGVSSRPAEIYCVINDSCSKLSGDFSAMLTSKLQSIWQLRQTTRGDGKIYKIGNGEFAVRTANIFLQGGFKGMLIQVDLQEEKGLSTPFTEQEKAGYISKIQNLLAEFDLLCTVDKLATSDEEIAKLYASLLQGKKG